MKKGKLNRLAFITVASVLFIQMYEDVYRMPNGVGRVIMEESDDTLATLFGRLCPLVDVQDNKNFLKIVCCSISKMYWRVLKYD